jgi:hypothetical protein
MQTDFPKNRYVVNVTALVSSPVAIIGKLRQSQMSGEMCTKNDNGCAMQTILFNIENLQVPRVQSGRIMFRRSAGKAVPFIPRQ